MHCQKTARYLSVVVLFDVSLTHTPKNALFFSRLQRDQNYRFPYALQVASKFVPIETPKIDYHQSTQTGTIAASLTPDSYSSNSVDLSNGFTPSSRHLLWLFVDK
jgi:hypothetical protein